MKDNILESYADGNLVSMIAENHNISEKEVIDILIEFKNESKHKKTFTDEFKTMIATRDMNGASRSSISTELGININTVRKACEQFGQATKEKAVSDNLYTRVDGEFSVNTCPSCGSRRNNLVDENTTFCMDCSMEHEYNFGKKDEDGNWIEKPYILKVNFEYLEE